MNDVTISNSCVTFLGIKPPIFVLHVAHQKIIFNKLKMAENENQ